jgi:GH25 family lysozyme M1 (1,4-beta-N-acetylmuramidase)
VLQVVERAIAVLVGAFLLLTGVVAMEPAQAATGPDVASWQHPNGAPIDWNQVRAAGHDFAFVKADEGPVRPGVPYYTNPYFKQDWNGIASAGLYRGAYHYARPKWPLSTAIEDARHFISVTGTMQGGLDLPPVLDLEETGGLAPAEVAQWARLWLQEVERLTGRAPIIYTGFYFWRDAVGGPTDFGRYPLWIANWTGANAPSPIPSSWSTWTFWQWTATGSSPGVPWTVDLNRFCCPDSSLGLLAGGGDPAFSNPFGAIDGATRKPNAIEISGWTVDPDTTASIPVHIYVDGAIAGSTLAGAARPDVGGAFPGFGSAHGFAFSAPVGPGTHTICAYAINAGAGNANSLLGCRTLVSNPIGAVDVVAQEPGGAVRVSGWSFDPDTTGPVQVGMFVNGQPWASATAGEPRPDLAHALDLATTNHGFSVALQGLTTAPVEVCALAINVGSGSNQVIGCRTIDARRTPRGSFDMAQVGDNEIRLRGWALDPDTAGSIPVHVYVDGQFDRSVNATTSRPDVGAAFQGWGNAHGFEVSLPDRWVAEHDVCVYAINVGAGNVNPFLGCKRVRPQGEPFGSVDAVTRVSGGIRVSGWVIDPNMVYPADVHVYVDGIGTAVTADRTRPDVASAFAFYGAWHGFDAVIPASSGSHQVCVWGINVGQGMSHRLLDCRTV